MRRGDDAHVDAAMLASRRRGVTSRVSSTRRSFACTGEGELADLVEEQRAAVGRLEAARLRRSRAGERAAARGRTARSRASASGIAAQLTATNGAVRARAAAVERARDELLARAALAGEEQRSEPDGATRRKFDACEGSRNTGPTMTPVTRATARPSNGRRGRRRGGTAELAHAQPRRRARGGLPHACAIDEGAVAALQVGHDEATVEREPCVSAGAHVVGQGPPTGVVTADDEPALGQADSAQLRQAAAEDEHGPRQGGESAARRLRLFVRVRLRRRVG